MLPILFEPTETAFTSNGLGRLQAVRCEVTEERNGPYELEIDVPVWDPHYKDIRLIASYWQPMTTPATSSRSRSTRTTSLSMEFARSTRITLAMS